MKKLLFLILLISSFAFYTNAQSKVSDIGLNYRGYDLFGVRYRIGNDKTLLRLTLLNLGGTSYRRKETAYDTKANRNGLGLNIGLEKRRLVKNNLNFYFGPELMNTVERSVYKSNTKSKDLSYTAGIGCILGFVYSINDAINISAEVIPSVWYTTHKSTFTENSIETSRTNHDFGYGFNHEFLSNSFANVTLSFNLGDN